MANLSGADGSWANLPSSGSHYAAVVDPELGRIALPAGGRMPRPLTVSYYYGFNADMAAANIARHRFHVSDPPICHPDTERPALC